MTIPKVNVCGVTPGEDAAQYHLSLTDQRIVGAFMEFYITTLGIPPEDAELFELVRIRNAVAQSCEY
jgi:hypothetical protein